jgi:hypothetical protein
VSDKEIHINSIYSDAYFNYGPFLLIKKKHASAIEQFSDPEIVPKHSTSRIHNHTDAGEKL